MARTIRKTKYKKWQCKEKKCFRKEHYAKHRHKTKQLLKDERWEDIPRLRKTCGWLTW